MKYNNTYIYICIYTKGKKKFKNQKHCTRSSKKKFSLMRSSIVIIVILKRLKDMKNDQFLAIYKKTTLFPGWIYYFQLANRDCYHHYRSACRTFYYKCPRENRDSSKLFLEIARHVSINKCLVRVCIHHTIIRGQR